MGQFFFIFQEERKRIEERRKRREENEKKSQIVQVVCQECILFYSSVCKVGLVFCVLQSLSSFHVAIFAFSVIELGGL